MLGEIRGRSAGDTSWFPLMHPRFLLASLPFASLRVAIGLETTLVTGDAAELAIGVGLAVDKAELMCNGADLGVACASMRGVMSPLLERRSPEFGCASGAAASGNIKSSSIGTSALWCSGIVLGTEMS